MSSVKEHLKPSTAISSSQDRMRSSTGAGQGFRPLTHNAYRILGLPSSASQREIFEAAASLRRAQKLGVSKSFDSDLPWLGAVARAETDVRDALSRLSNPAQRIYERLFWFYDAQAARISNLDELEPAVAKLTSRQDGAGRHDAALLSLAVALRLHPSMEDGAVWRRSLALWHEIVEAREFWSLLMSTDLKGDFEQVVTFAEIKELRLRVLQLVTAHIADVARDASARRDFNNCRRALSVLRESGLPLKMVARYENDVLGPIEDELSALCDETFRQVQFDFTYGLNSAMSACDETYYKFNEELRPRLKRFLDLAGPSSLSVYRLMEATAAGLRSLAHGYNRAGAEAKSAKLYRKAWMLAPPGSLVAEEIAEAFGTDEDKSYFRTRNEDEYERQLAQELQPLPRWKYDYPPPQNGASVARTLHTSKPRQENAGCVTAAICFGLAIAIGIICNQSGSHSSYNSNLPGLYNANFYRPTYNSNIYLPPTNITPPPVKVEPLVIPSLERGAKQKRRARRAPGVQRQEQLR